MCQGYSPNSVLLSRSVPKNSHVSLVNIVHIYKNSYLSLRTQSHFHSICLQVQPFTRRTISELLIATYKKNNLRASPTVQPLIKKKSQCFSNWIATYKKNNLKASPAVQPLTRKTISKLLQLYTYCIATYKKNNLKASEQYQSFSKCTAVYKKNNIKELL